MVLPVLLDELVLAVVVLEEVVVLAVDVWLWLVVLCKARILSGWDEKAEPFDALKISVSRVSVSISIRVSSRVSSIGINISVCIISISVSIISIGIYLYLCVVRSMRIVDTQYKTFQRVVDYSMRIVHQHTNNILTIDSGLQHIYDENTRSDDEATPILI